MVLLYAFFNSDHITYKLVKAVLSEDLDKYYIGNLDSLINKAINSKYSYILGFGDFRKGSNKIRIERVFGNRYGKKEIIDAGQEKYISNWDFPESEEAVYSDKATIGPCNKSAYLLSRAIHDNSLKTKLAFIHVP